MSTPSFKGYVSSADADWPIHAELCSWLEAEIERCLGKPVWLVRPNIQEGSTPAQIEATTMQSIDETCFFIAMITPDFVASAWCAFDVDVFRGVEMDLQDEHPALDNEGLIFPIYLRDIDGIDAANAEMLEELRARPWLDLRTEMALEGGSEALRGKVSTLAARIAAILGASFETRPGETFQRGLPAASPQPDLPPLIGGLPLELPEQTADAAAEHEPILVERILWRVARLYFLIGMAVGGMRMLAFFVWMFSNILSLEPLPGFGDRMRASGAVVIGIGGSILNGLFWPVPAYWVATGQSSLGETLFYPVVYREDASSGANR